MPLPLVQRLCLYFEKGVPSRRAAIETRSSIFEVRAYYRRFHALGIKRASRQGFTYDRRPLAEYKGPAWIGKANSVTPLPVGPDWIGKRHVSTDDQQHVR